MDFFFDGKPPIADIVIRAFIGFLWLILLLRLSGKRVAANFNLYDMILTFSIGSILSSLIIFDTVKTGEAMLGMALIVGLDWILSWLALKSSFVSSLLKAPPTVLMYDGEILEKNVRQERIVEEEIDMLLRQNGIASRDEVHALVFESAGDISVVRKSEPHGDGAAETMKKILKSDAGIGDPDVEEETGENDDMENEKR